MVKDRQALTAALMECGVDTSAFEWLTTGESRSIVQHWVDLGAERYGRLALIPPASAAMSGRLTRDAVPDWLVRDSSSTHLLFQDYGSIGIARCDWNVVLENLAQLAHADGDGFAAIVGEVEGVALVDLDHAESGPRLTVEVWGDRIDGSPREMGDCRRDDESEGASSLAEDAGGWRRIRDATAGRHLPLRTRHRGRSRAR